MFTIKIVNTVEACNNKFYHLEEIIKVNELRDVMSNLLSTLEDGDKCDYIKISVCKEKIKEVLDNEDDLC